MLGGGHGLFYGYRVDAHPEQPGRFSGVVEARLAGEPRRQTDAAYMRGSERVHGNGRGERRVDAAGHAKDDSRETVLADVIAKAQHHRAVNRVQPWRARPVRLSLAAKGFAVERPPREDERLAPERHHAGERAVGVHDERSAVEHQFVLTANLIHIRQRYARF